MSKPIVAIVGRANVGKSTLFNKICGKRISIVDDVAGVTRDRIYADAEWCGQEFSLVDTGGLEDKSEDVFQSEIKEQVDLALETADVIIFLVDGKVSVKLLNPLGQQGNLNCRRAGVGFVFAEFGDDFFLLFRCKHCFGTPFLMRLYASLHGENRLLVIAQGIVPN